MAKPAFYVHIADPGFPEPPWPGERRLGPFLTLEEAEAQAVSDLAQGHVADDLLLGVYSESESAARDERLTAAYLRHVAKTAERFDPRGRKAGRSEVTPSRLRGKADTVRRRMLEERARSLDQQREALRQLLPEGVTVEEFEAIVRRGGAQP